MDDYFDIQLPHEVEQVLREGAQRLIEAEEVLIACEMTVGLGQLMEYLACEEGRPVHPDRF